MLGSGPRRGPGSGRWRDGPLRLVSGSKLWARRAPGGGARTACWAPGWSSARAAAPPGSPGARGPGCCCPCVRVLTSVFPWPQTGVADPQVRCCLPGLLPAAAQPGPPAPHAGVDEMPWGHGGHGGLVLPLRTRVLSPAVPPDPGQVPPQQAAGLMAGRPAGRSGGRGPVLPRQGPNRGAVPAWSHGEPAPSWFRPGWGGLPRPRQRLGSVELGWPSRAAPEDARRPLGSHGARWGHLRGPGLRALQTAVPRCHCRAAALLLGLQPAWPGRLLHVGGQGSGRSQFRSRLCDSLAGS